MTSDNQNDVIALGNMIFDSKKVQILKLNNIFKYWVSLAVWKIDFSASNKIRKFLKNLNYHNQH